MSTRHPFLDTCEQLLGQQTPNLFRLYLNPFVVQTCLCLARYVQSTWYGKAPERPKFQSFLANGSDEALSGAIKLARYCAGVEKRPPSGLVVDCDACLGDFAAASVGGRGRIELIPELTVVGAGADLVLGPDARFGFVVVALSPGLESWDGLGELVSLVRRQAPLVILCVGRADLDRLRRSSAGLEGLAPDVVVFDESFVHRHVPFGAFTAKKTLYDYWNTPGNATFHSTTYQPNSVSTLHFLRCLEGDDREFFAELSGELGRVRSDPAFCKSLLGELYSPSLCKTIAVLGMDTPDVRADGHYVVVKGRRIFDGVGGVACSVRGHNPPTYVDDLAALGHVQDYHEAAALRLKGLTGLECLLPAVSGASAVENALRVGLVAQAPKNYVLAFRGGFGGKTLLALTGTARDSYKAHLGPLYPNVVYVDPHGERALDDIEAALDRYPVGVVQLELIQAVGGVRPVPERVVRYLAAHRRERGYLLFIDEVQTGMYRAGPFILSEKLGVVPDILTIGKGTSDMMFPFAVTLCSAAVRDRLDAANPDLAGAVRRKFDYEHGYKTLLSTLDRAEKIGLSERVSELAALFARLLGDGLSGCRAVRDVRVHGLLIGVELSTDGWLPRWLKGKAPLVYILNMLARGPFPVFLGYCQYEPNVLKLTPPLSITPEEVEQVCDTMKAVLRSSPSRLLPPVLGALVKSSLRRGWKVR